MTITKTSIFVFLSFLIVYIDAHARLLNPPARSSAWRENLKKFPTYVDDNEMNCGGFYAQWYNNGSYLNFLL
jgi:hypothetical protein